KPKPFWVLKNFTVPTGIKSFLSRFLLNAHASSRWRSQAKFLGVHLRRSPKPGAWQQVEAENQVAGGHIDGFRCNVNGTGCNQRYRIMFYEFVKASCYSLTARRRRQLTETE